MATDGWRPNERMFGARCHVRDGCFTAAPEPREDVRLVRSSLTRTPQPGE